MASGSRGSNSRPSAMEKPRSAASPRQRRDSDRSWLTMAGSRSRARRTWQVNPARWARCQLCRAIRTARPSRVKAARSRMASSPRYMVKSPACSYTRAAAWPQPITAATRPCRAASARKAAATAGHCSGGPMGSPAASATVPTVP